MLELIIIRLHCATSHYSLSLASSPARHVPNTFYVHRRRKPTTTQLIFELRLVGSINIKTFLRMFAEREESESFITSLKNDSFPIFIAVLAVDDVDSDSCLLFSVVFLSTRKLWAHRACLIISAQGWRRSTKDEWQYEKLYRFVLILIFPTFFLLFVSSVPFFCVLRSRLVRSSSQHTEAPNETWTEGNRLQGAFSIAHSLLIQV